MEGSHSEKKFKNRVLTCESVYHSSREERVRGYLRDYVEGSHQEKEFKTRALTCENV